MRVGCSTVSFAPFPLERAVATIAELGFGSLDVAAIPTFAEHIRGADPGVDQPARLTALVTGLGLTVEAVPSIVWFPDALDDPEELRRRGTVVADSAAALGASSWIVDAGHPGDGDVRAGLDRLTGTLAIYGDLARERGLRLAVEAPHVGTLAEHHEQIPAVLAAATAAGVEIGLDLDTGHVHDSGITPTEYMAAYGARVAHVAFRDTSAGAGTHVPLGEGDIDFALWLRLLRDNGFTGDVMLELDPGQDATPEERIAAVRHGRDVVEKLLRDL
jgi:sugar phosphate isomerase/epimerase